MKAENHVFVAYYTKYKDKLEIIILTYTPYHFYSFNSFGILRMQIDNISILDINDSINTEKNTIQSAKRMKKYKKHFISIYLLKFYSA